MLEVRNLRIQINNRIIIDNTSFRVGQGKVVAIIGEDDVSNTSICEAIMNLRPIDTGEIISDETLISTTNPETSQKVGLIYAKQFQTDKQGYKQDEHLMEWLSNILKKKPRTLILQDPFQEIEDNSLNDLSIYIRSLAQKYNIGILFTEKDVARAYMVADYIIALRDGQECYHGEAKTYYEKSLEMKAVR